VLANATFMLKPLFVLLLTISKRLVEIISDIQNPDLTQSPQSSLSKKA
jgi:hypothetical protein